MQEILIDGIACEIARTGVVKNGFEGFWEYGTDKNGRKCRVGHHTLPPYVLDNGGKAYTSGTLYEIKKG